MSTDVIQIYVPLLNEGTDVVRPTNGVLLASDLIRVEPTEDYDPELEEWQPLGVDNEGDFDARPTPRTSPVSSARR